MASNHPDQLSLFDAAHTTAGRAVSEAGDELPRVAREMVEVMGERATMALIHELGGRRIVVPGLPLKRVSSRYDFLVGVVGAEAAEAFAHRWGGIEVQVPMARRAVQRMRDRRIVKAYSEGTKVPALAGSNGLTESTVWKILKKDVDGG